MSGGGLSNIYINRENVRTSLLRRLQAQTLPDANPPIGEIHPFSNIAVVFEPMIQFVYPLRFRMPYTCETISILLMESLAP